MKDFTNDEYRSILWRGAKEGGRVERREISRRTEPHKDRSDPFKTAAARERQARRNR